MPQHPPARETADSVADLVLGDPGADGGHHAREIQAELRLLAVERRVAAEGGQHIGEVDAGGADRDFDLPGFGGGRSAATNSRVCRSPGVRISRRMPSRSGSTSGGPPLLGPQRSLPQPRGVPRSLPPGGLVLGGAAEQFLRHPIGGGVRVDVDLGRPQRRVFGTDDPQQAPHPALIQVDPVVRASRPARRG